MGILDFFQQTNSPYPEDMRYKAGMQSLGLLGGTMMAAGAPSTDPGQYGRIMAQGLAQAGPMMQQSLDQQMQMQDMMAEREREAAMQAYMESPEFGAGMSPEQMEFIRLAPPEIGMGLLGDSLFAQPDLLKSNQTGTFKTPTGEIVMGTYNDAIANGWTEYRETDPWDGINIPTGFGPVDPNNPAAGIQPLPGYDPNYGKTPDAPPARRLVEVVDPNTGQKTFMWDTDAVGMVSGMPEDGGGSPFGGSAMDIQLINTLRTADSNSQDYAIAYSILGAPKYSYNPATNTTTYITPDMSMFPEPTFILPSDGTIGAPPMPTDASPVAETPTVNDRSGGVQVVKSDELPLEDQRAYNAGNTVISRVEAALNAYRSILMPNGQMLGREELLDPTSPASIKVAAARTDLMMEMKELFELGVLTGPDMDLLEDMTADPTSFFSRGILMGPEGFAAQFDVISEKLGAARTILDEQYGIAQPAQDGGSAQDAPTAPAPVRDDGTFTGTYTPEGYPVYIRPDGTSFALVNNDG